MLAFGKWEEKEEIIGKDRRRRGKIFAILEKNRPFWTKRREECHCVHDDKKREREKHAHQDTGRVRRTHGEQDRELFYINE